MSNEEFDTTMFLVAALACLCALGAVITADRLFAADTTSASITTGTVQVQHVTREAKSDRLSPSRIEVWLAEHRDQN
jgi:hypothetical protein